MTVLALDLVAPEYRRYARGQATCDGCGRRYNDYPSRIAKAAKHYCSAACYRSNRGGDRNPKWRGGPKPRSCVKCGAQFGLYGSSEGKGIYCSTKCKHNAQRIYPSKRIAVREGGRRREARERAARAIATHTRAEWLALLEKFGQRCAHCGVSGKLTRDHIMPLSKGGDDAIENIQPLCHSCNARKWAHT